MLLSYCTTTMDRKFHLERTLLVNLMTCRLTGTYDCSEFLILDYGSRDGVKDWFLQTKQKYPDLLERVRLFSITDPVTYFNVSVAKNTCYALASGEVIVNLDADNLLLHGYDELVVKEVCRKPGRFLSPPDNSFYGKIACRKSDFLKAGGYNERLSYGMAYEDTDLVERLEALGLDRVQLPESFKCRIDHTEAVKLANVPNKNMEEGINIHHSLMRQGIHWRRLDDVPYLNTIEVTYA